ncbi:GNAT family N-acetyltransferase [Mycobacterium intracellulare]|uniref:GNAT family N-acetyltransferase n=1 Tax=Mycobacterium intracellulare subsp. chimaera TaxID=222805 RepID=A0A7U5RV57_MYCIT|nr:GNAT family N-acetyltransferase [Mycobacterium intracellulare]ASL15163.1 N-acetyltransferase GCN5 [Mycobacterium intracellulare subsp. chimaera]MCF1815950.1 GNAT family N-acetyltransferase [Mycobacterium intracellulare subsp. intracellulare]MDM3929459.1 GNAT family N-acetyltransferase [Mycobacterium intracellulare subsp. chimaera]MDS0337858.1 GNAT family N-acetyltransferase [Mycobacterium intracellulare]
MDGHAVGDAATCQLLDGRIISLRRIDIEDAGAVAALHQHLSDHDRYLRFFTMHPPHLDELVSTLIEPKEGRYALGAFDGNRLIGVANYTICADPTAADIAIVVAHEDHSLGVGTALVKRLAQIAGAHGIRRFVADVLAQNHLMLAVLSDFGWSHERTNCGSVLHLDIGLPGSVCLSPSKPRAFVKGV